MLKIIVSEEKYIKKGVGQFASFFAKSATSYAQDRDKLDTTFWTVCVILRVILHDGSTASSGMKIEVRVTCGFWSFLRCFPYWDFDHFMKNLKISRVR